MSADERTIQLMNCAFLLAENPNSMVNICHEYLLTMRRADEDDRALSEKEKGQISMLMLNMLFRRIGNISMK